MKCANFIEEFSICKITAKNCTEHENCKFYTNEENVNEQILSTLEGIVRDFLLENGGYSNGYETFVEGIVKKDVVHSLKWKTPEISKLTEEEVQSKGFELNNKIREVMNFFTIKEVKITAEDKNFGAYNTVVSYEARRHVYLPHKKS